ncbi:lipocalin family protein [Pseudomonas guineae]|uniref:lipocalin family protein n=1 Tax=Pseudomonas guineae TaxID=425504 RepID=UPI003D06D2B4
MRLLAVFAAAIALVGCANSGTGTVPPKTVEQVDLQRYQGTWYEQARLPMFFQRNCAQSEAIYNVQEGGTLGVTNRCRSFDGDVQQVQGQAVAQVPGETSKLWVRFDNWVSTLLPGLTKGEYWVLYLDDDYHTALVGHPNRQYLWLLTRDQTLSAQSRETLLEEARSRGYDTRELIWRRTDAEMALQR